MGAETGFFSVLHTWNQQLLLHPHVHCVVPAGGLSLDHTRWIGAPPGFFLPVKILSRVFRGKFIAGLRELHRDGRLVLSGAPSAIPFRLGSLLQTTFRRRGACPALSRRLHPSGRHLQPPPRRSSGWLRDLSLARLRPQEQAALGASARCGVPASLLPACTTARVRAHPLFRIPGSPPTRHAPAALP